MGPVRTLWGLLKPIDYLVSAYDSRTTGATRMVSSSGCLCCHSLRKKSVPFGCCDERKLDWPFNRL